MGTMTIEVPAIEELLELRTAHALGEVRGDGSAKARNAGNQGSLPEAYGPHSLSAVMPALSDAIGCPVATALHQDPAQARQALGFPEARSAIVALVDGLGFWNIAMRVGHAPYLRSLLSHTENEHPISTCMPSTTVAAMGTFGTGTCPGMTAMTGYTQRNPQTGNIAQLIQFKDSLPPHELQQQPTVFEQLARHTRVTSVGLPKFADSPLTQAALRGATYQGHISPSSRIALACRAATTPGLTYLYIRDTDKVGHNYGWDSLQWTEAFERVDAQLSLLRRSAPKGTLIVIVADHGMISADPEQCIDIAEHPGLAQGVAQLGGEPRAPMLYVEPSHDVEEVAERWRDRLAGRAVVQTRDEAISSGVYGLVEDRVKPMIGDIVVAALHRVTIVDSRTQSEKAISLPSVHGSRSAVEMDIPCFIDMA